MDDSEHKKMPLFESNLMKAYNDLADKGPLPPSPDNVTRLLAERDQLEVKIVVPDVERIIEEFRQKGLIDQPHEITWRNFWKPLLMEPNGQVRLDAIKRELHDYHTLLEEVPKVYMHVSGGKISKPNTKAEAVIEEADLVVADKIEALLQEHDPDDQFLDSPKSEVKAS